MRWAVIAIALAGCGGSADEALLQLLGKPCAAESDCSSVAGVHCVQLDVEQEMGCEYVVPPDSTDADCPDGTRLWQALISYPTVQWGWYCSVKCTVVAPDQVGTCNYGRHCAAVCVDDP